MVSIPLDMARLFLSTPSARRATQKAMATAYCQNDFYPRPPRGGRHVWQLQLRQGPRISIHALREEGDAGRLKCRTRHADFYPRPPRGGRPNTPVSLPPVQHFYPRPPRGGRPRAEWCIIRTRRYFYPRPPRGGRQLSSIVKLPPHIISIHALREEGDRWGRLCMGTSGYFYPRPPRGGRPTTILTALRHLEFLSTPSARRATHRRLPAGWVLCHFYPRPPRGGRQPSRGGIRL